MARPSLERWSAAYRAAQSERTSATLDQILGRTPRRTALVVPDPHNLTLHDARDLQATVMFLDICSFSGRVAESRDQQFLLMRALALFFAEMIRIIEDHGGVVEKNTGDGLMAYFPKGVEADWAKRPIAASLTSFATAEALINPVLLASGLEPFRFRISLDSGAITVAKLGSAQRFSALVAVGTTANIASKLLALAEANTLIVGDAVVDGVPAAWRPFLTLEPKSTGWRYGPGGPPYPAWRYTGRWTTPQ